MNKINIKIFPEAIIYLLSSIPLIEMTRYYCMVWFYFIAVLYIFCFFYLSLFYSYKFLKSSFFFKIIGIILLTQLIIVSLSYYLINKNDINICVLLMANFIALPSLAFDYYGAYINEIVKYIIFIICILLFFLLKFGLKKKWIHSFFTSVTILYLISFYIIFGLYYKTPIKHTYEDIKAQQYHEIIKYKVKHPASRKLAIDNEEKYLYVAYTSSFSFRDNGRPGLFKYDINKKEEILGYGWGGASLVLPPKGDTIFLSVYKYHIIELYKDTFKETGKYYDIGPGLDKIELLDTNTIVVQNEYPLEDDIFFINFKTDKIWTSKISKIPNFSLNNTLEPYTKTGEVFELQNGFNRHRLIKVSRDGKEIDSVDLDFSIEVYYGPKSDKVYVPSFKKDIMYIVNPETLKYKTVPVKRIIREIVEYPDGNFLIMANYLCAEIYIYSIKDELIKKTLLTGRKPEAIGIGKKTKRLFVASNIGIQIFDLEKIISNLK